MHALRLAALLILATPLAAQQLTTPEQALGFGIGADYHLATYQQLHSWWQKLSAESPRMELDTIGTTAEGRPQVMAILSSPANLARLEEYRRISEQLARGRVGSRQLGMFSKKPGCAICDLRITSSVAVSIA